jgi:tripartite-type tricarboxylate transporter receptor subunit TctC
MAIFSLVLSAIIVASRTAWVEYPARSVTLSIGFEPGGTIDLVARTGVFSIITTQ